MIAQSILVRFRRDLVKRRTRHPDYAKSQRIRMWIGEAFGWIQTIAGMCRTKLHGLAKVDWSFTFAATAYNLARMPKLLAATT